MKDKLKTIFTVKMAELTAKTGVKYDPNEIFKRIEAHEHYLKRNFVEKPTTKEEINKLREHEMFNLNKDFQLLYSDTYYTYMRRNLTSNKPYDEKLETFVHFNVYMNDLLVSEFRDIFGEDSIKDDAYSFGGLSEESMKQVNDEILQNEANIDTKFKKFLYDNKKNNVTLNHFEEIKNEINNRYDSLAKLGDANYAKEKFVPLYSVLYNHYNKRSIFSQYFTINGWKERSLLKEMKSMTANLLAEPGLKNMSKEAFNDRMSTIINSNSDYYDECVRITNEINEKTGDKLSFNNISSFVESDEAKKLGLISDELGKNVFMNDAPEIETNTRTSIEFNEDEINEIDFDNAEPIDKEEVKNFLDDDIELGANQ